MDTEEELSYEEEQLQRILINEIEEKKLQVERAFKEEQTNEYLAALKMDEENQTKEEKVTVEDKVLMKTEIKVDEVSVEEMRQIRLLRFQNK
mgnify:FL=1|jgi:hypothetical protein|tara:strand:- start:1014 stop:1289 length:276 start_codon:yes stop_codon:yes gene_type:complete